MIKLERPLVTFDLETTGLDKENDRIVEFALLKVYPDGNRESKSYRVNPGIPIPAESSAITGIYDEDVKDCPPFAKYAPKIIQFIEGCDLATFNGNSFDIPFIYNEFLRSGINWDYAAHKSVDAGNIFKIKNPRTLTAAYQIYCGKDHSDAHSALADVEATYEVLMAQIELYSADEDFPKDIESLALFSNHGKKIADVSGKFVYDDDGDLVINFTQDKRGQKAKNHLSFISWMVGKDFAPDTIHFCRLLLEAEYNDNLSTDDE